MVPPVALPISNRRRNEALLDEEAKLEAQLEAKCKDTPPFQTLSNTGRQSMGPLEFEDRDSYRFMERFLGFDVEWRPHLIGQTGFTATLQCKDVISI